MGLVTNILTRALILAVYEGANFVYASGNRGTLGRVYLVTCTPVADEDPSEIQCADVSMGTSENKIVIVNLQSQHYKHVEDRGFGIIRGRIQRVQLEVQYRTKEDGTRGLVKLEGNGTFSAIIHNLVSGFSGDSYMAIPIDAWTNKYYIIMFTGSPSLIIMSAHEDTIVDGFMKNNTGLRGPMTRTIAYFSRTIEGINFRSGQPFHLVLKKYTGFQLHVCGEKENNDFTGSHLTASHPIGVIVACCLCGSKPKFDCKSGKLANTPASRDSVTEMLMPEETYAQEYLVMAGPRRKSMDTVKIVAAYPKTNYSYHETEDDIFRGVLQEAGDWVAVRTKSGSLTRYIAHRPV